MARSSAINLGDWRLNNRSTGSNFLDTRINKGPGFGQRGAIYINSTSCVRREILGGVVNCSKVENSARSDAAEENSARLEEIQSE
ncbi:unnamed protein product [Hymenolepis diminuta]|uniref:Uncharacterized protein n=1 Tax=Hymenolepis diminuta TaxID=6216 RepID=A0A564Z218_HYMDI|nr:unnamed protein product [Hymenolepis diminuta]